MRPIFTIFILIFIIPKAISQGNIDGFYLSENKLSVTVGGGYENSNDYLAGTEEVGLSRNAYYLSLFAAYGLRDDLDINVSIPYIESGDNKNLQDLYVGIKYKIKQYNFSDGSLELSSAVGLSTPLSDYEIGDLNDIGQQATIIETRAMAHYKDNSGWFATVQSGFSFKQKETPNSLPVALKLGKATSSWYYDVFYDYQHSFGGIDYLGTPGPQNFREFSVDYHKVGGTLYRTVREDFGVFVSYSYILEGRNIFTGPTYSAGITYTL